MSRSCQRALFSRPAGRSRAPRGPGRRSARVDRVPLVGHGRRALLALAEGSSASRTSVRCRWRISSAIFSSDEPPRPGREELGVAVALTIWVETGAGVRPSRAQTRSSTSGEVGEGADRARDLADGDARGRARRRVAVAVDLGVPQQQLEPERGRLGVHAVGAPDHRGVLVLDGAAPEHSAQCGPGALEQLAGRRAATHSPCRRRRTRSGRSERSARPARAFGEGRGERDHIVAGGPLDLVDALGKGRVDGPPVARWRLARGRLGDRTLSACTRRRRARRRATRRSGPARSRSSISGRV